MKKINPKDRNVVDAWYRGVNWYSYFPFLMAVSQDTPIMIESVDHTFCIFIDHGNGVDLYLSPISVNYANWQKMHPEPSVIDWIFENELVGDDPAIWIDYEGFSLVNYQKKFFSNEYINDPTLIHSLKGRKLKKLRHAVRHFEYYYDYIAYDANRHKSEVMELLDEWNKTQALSYEVVFDKDYTQHLVELVDVFPDLKAKIMVIDGQIVTINIWGELDEDTAIFLVSKNDLKFKWISEYSRWLFYSEIKDQYKLVNDGGDVDSKGLRQFKNKFNPIQKKPLYSWKK